MSAHDDEDLVRASTADMLTEMGYEVVEASSALEALEVIGGAGHFDLFITDHLMPGMTGAQFAREVWLRSPNIPVLIISGYADIEGITPDLTRLTKPFRQADLAACLAGLVVKRD